MTKRDEHIQTVLEQISCIMRRARSSMHFPLNDQGLTRPQIHILMMLHHGKDGLTTTELAQKLAVTPGAITQFVDGLVEKGFVKRRVDKDDRRIIRIALTKKSHTIFHKFKSQYYAAMKPQFQAFSESELTHLLQLLQKTSPPDSHPDCD